MHHLRFALAAAAILTTAATAAALELGATLGPVELTTLAGEPIVMKNYAERPGTAIVFLSSRCPLTERVIGDVNQLYRKYRFRDVLFVGVSANAAESGDELRTFAQRRGVIFPIYRDPKGATAKQLGASKTPELFLFDRRGVLVFHGGLQDDAARGAVEKAIVALAHPPAAGASHAVEGTPIDRPAQRREIDDPYGTIHFSSELVFEKIPRAVAFHCSTICQTAGGDLLCLWYGGSYESADDQALFLARKRPGEPNWSTPQVLIENSAHDGAPQPPGNGVIFRDAGNRLWIVWCRMEGTRPTRRGSGWDRCRLMARTSTDDGASWSPDHPLVDETVWCVPRNPPVALADGTLLLPVEGLQGDVEGSHFFTLAPEASTWRRAGFTPGGSQPAVALRSDGSLLALLRHSQFIRQVESRDAGQTWSQAVPTPLKNPDSGITMTRLANGHLVLVFNDSQSGRTPLSIIRSLDEGRTWEKPLHLESNPGEYSYPCIIQTADGQIHVSYTFRRYSIKHVELNEDWLVHMNRPN